MWSTLLLFACQPVPRPAATSGSMDTTSSTATDTTSPSSGTTSPSGTTPSSTEPSGTTAGCPVKTSTEIYEQYPVYIQGTNRRFTTIQNGIWGAKDGDEVVVCPGTYTENIDFKGRQITLRSEAGATQTIIDGQGLDAVVYLRNHETAEAVLEGFTLTGGDSLENHGGGIYVEWGGPIIRHNIIIDNTANIGGGVYLRNTAAIVHNNIIAWNRADQGGGGITCSACGGAFRYNTMFENTCDDGPVGEYFWGTADLEGNLLVSEKDAPSPAFRLLDPREGREFSIDHNLLWPQTELVQDYTGLWPEGEGWVYAQPLFADPDSLDFQLLDGSPGIDAGPPHETDPDGSRADLGAFGGPDGSW